MLMRKPGAAHRYDAAPVGKRHCIGGDCGSVQAVCDFAFCGYVAFGYDGEIRLCRCVNNLRRRAGRSDNRHDVGRAFPLDKAHCLRSKMVDYAK